MHETHIDVHGTKQKLALDLSSVKDMNVIIIIKYSTRNPSRVIFDDKEYLHHLRKRKIASEWLSHFLGGIKNYNFCPFATKCSTICYVMFCIKNFIFYALLSVCWIMKSVLCFIRCIFDEYISYRN